MDREKLNVYDPQRRDRARRRVRRTTGLVAGVALALGAGLVGVTESASHATSVATAKTTSSVSSASTATTTPTTTSSGSSAATTTTTPRHLVVELRGQLDFGNNHSRIDGRFVGPARRAGPAAQPSTPLGSFAGSQPRTATAWRNAKRSVMPAT